MSQKIIITGGTGFVGRHLIGKLIAQGHQVFAIVRSESNTCDLPHQVNVRFHDGTTKGLIEIFKDIEPDVLHHVASKIISKHSSDQIDDLIDSNIKFGSQLMEASIASNCRKVVNTGTAWQHYENRANSPVCLYAATKQAFENIIDHYVINENMRVITLKLHDNYGVGDKRGKLLSLLIDSAYTGRPIDLTLGEQKMDLLHVCDVANAYLAASRILDSSQEAIHKKYMVYSGRQISIKGIAGLIENVTGRSVNASWGAREYREREMMNPPYFDEILPGWQPNVSLEEGIKEMWEWRKQSPI